MKKDRVRERAATSNSYLNVVFDHPPIRALGLINAVIRDHKISPGHRKGQDMGKDAILCGDWACHCGRPGEVACQAKW